MFLFLKRIISDNQPSLYDYLTLFPHIHLFPHSFQENWHDYKKFWRILQIPPPPIVQGGMMSWHVWSSKPQVNKKKLKAKYHASKKQAFQK